ncbi:MAG: outer spore coat protein CotE [Planifilum sp.]
MSNKDKGPQYRQIITKAICGRGRKFSQSTHSIAPPENISGILGAWIINHTYKASQVGETVEVTGSYDVNIWYSFDGNTQTDVAKETIRYVERVPLSYYDRNVREGTTEVTAAVTQPPNCIEAKIAGGVVQVSVEKEFLVEMIGETKVCVACYPDSFDEWDDKDLIVSNESDGETFDFDDLDPDLMVDDLDD